MIHGLTQLTYLAAAALFILSLRWLSSPKTARRGVAAGVGGMALAIIGTLFAPEIVNFSWIAIAALVGIVIGVPLSWSPLTAVPQRTALSHAFGGLAAGLVGTAKYMIGSARRTDPVSHRRHPARDHPRLPDVHRQPHRQASSRKSFRHGRSPYPNQNVVNLGLLAIAIGAGVYLTIDPYLPGAFAIIILLSLAFGVLLILPIGGADMPTVISLLNSYAGLSAVAMGFVLENKLLITAGALDGSSGLILSIIMCRAMNRSFTNVLFGAFGQVQAVAAAGEAKTAKSATPQDVGELLTNADRVVIVPGYGMAVAQAQHKVRELYDSAEQARR